MVDAAEGLLRQLRAGEPPVLSPPIDTGGSPYIAAATADEDLWLGQGKELVKVVAGKVVAGTPLTGTAVALAADAHDVWVATVDALVLAGKARRPRAGWRIVAMRGGQGNPPRG